MDPNDLVRQMIRLVGDDPDRAGLEDTPRRVIKAWGELFAGYGVSEDQIDAMLRKFDIGPYDAPVVVDRIPFYSFCEHHMLPFSGLARVTYQPGVEGVIGLSKIPRLVDVYARRLQVQERLTRQIAEAIGRHSLGAIVEIESTHHCLTARGRQARETTMKTRYQAGWVKGQN